ncbi:MAG: hypothetical protein IKN55_01840 [Oscillospiraceae bacterium]|nr:hypothetical protein [Oscillospiraceae bacterium]
MRTFLLEYGLYVEWVLAAAEVILTIILFSDFGKKRAPIILCMALLGLGLCIDAAVIGLGGKLVEPVLAILSQMRFTLHGLLVPLNLTICVLALPLWPIPRRILVVVTLLIMLAGGFTGFSREIALQEEIGDIVRFASVSPRDSWMEIANSVITYGCIIPVIITGIYLLLRERSASILLGSVLMFSFAALGPATGNFDLIFLITMFGELFLLLFYTIYEKRHTDAE